MYVDTISLTDFRNYASLEFHPSDGVNVLFGLNAQGKSAILEAIYLLATSKSHRTSRDLDLIRIGRELTRVCGEVKRSARNDVTLEVILSRTEKKSVRIDKAKHSRIGDLVGHLNAVIFSSMDIDMVRGEPSLRRRFLNLEISQISPQYVYALGRYKRVLDQRNSVLKELKLASGSASALDVWNSQLSTYGATVMARRLEFVRFLAKRASELYASLTDGAESLTIAYKPSLETPANDSEQGIAAALESALAARRENDVSRGTTTVGPHRDDVGLVVDGMPVREYGSQGQQRTVAIAMKLAEIDLMTDSSGEPPVVLLDDVMAELDDVRRSQVFALTGGRCQTFITTTHLAELSDEVKNAAALFEVAGGTVRQA
jgi:DNA replication and repair protein RecF